MSTQDPQHTGGHISDLRAHLLGTLAALRDRTNPMEPDRARAIAQVAGVLVDSARVEVDYVKATGQDNAPFLEAKTELPLGITHDGANSTTPTAHNPFPGVTRHRLVG